MDKKIHSHGKYHGMFPMMFYCKFCECVFECESISDVEIWEFNWDVFARTRCPECQEWVKNIIGSREPEIEVNDYE